MRRRRALAVLLLVVAAASAVGAMVVHRGAKAERAPTPRAAAPTGAATKNAGSRSAVRTLPPAPAPSGLLGEVAALGPQTLTTIPTATTQAVVVRGDAAESSTASIEVFSLSGGAWRRTGAWRGHVGAKGWTTQHREGDLRTPVGTYTLSDAGGRLPNPGTRLPYYASKDFVPRGDGVFGDSLAGSFDYVIAVDFNRRKGVSPLDQSRPQGEAAGGGIWLHVDHAGPTHGCVSVPREGMQALLRTLSPESHPILVMADDERLSA